MAPQPVIVVAPYLPIDKVVEIGPWRLEPADQVKSQQVRKNVPLQALLRAYGIPGSNAGAVARHGRKRIGAPVVDTASIDQLHWSLVYGVLSARMPLSDDDAFRGTADNALVYGHNVGNPTFTAIYEGGIFVTLKGVPLTGQIGTIPPPEHLFIPSNLPDLDEERMAALYEELGNGRVMGRRMRRALQWMAFAWTNTNSITDDARIVALHTAFEALLTKQRMKEKWDLREHLSELLAPKGPRKMRRYRDRGRLQSREMTDIGWWFQKFTMLRNEIIHGDSIRRQNLVFGRDKESHITLASRHLLTALLELLVRAGHSRELRDDELRRNALRILAAHARP